MGMSLYEALYGRRCRTPVTWDNLVNRVVLGPDLLKEMEQEVVNIKYKSYADQHRVNSEFSVGNHVYLRVREKKSSLKLGNCAKLSPIYCGPFEVLERMVPVAYRLAFPASTRAHNFFRVSFLSNMYLILTMSLIGM